MLSFYVGGCKQELTPKEARHGLASMIAVIEDMPNLVIAGPGLFPTSGGVNPTFTVHALAARSSEYLLNHWNSIIQ